MKAASSNTSSRLSDIRSAAAAGKLKGHAIAEDVATRSSKVESAWGPAMRV